MNKNNPNFRDDSTNALIESLTTKNVALHMENARMKHALNTIGMLGKSELAYTSEFTERVRSLVHKGLNLEEKF